jgi:hypothetical protein
MRRVLRSVPWLLVAACAACAACNGDYWLGGARASGADGASGGGGTGAATGGAGGRATLIEAGPNDRVLSADIVLTGDDSLDLSSNDAGPCRLIGNGYAIRSRGTWVGHLSIRGCFVQDLGSASVAAIALEMSGGASTTIEGVTFDTSGAVQVTNSDDSTTTFRNNVIEGNSTVLLDPSADVTKPAFVADGASVARKVFQGNRIYRSSVSFQSANWLIGGDTDAESNIIVGLRAGIDLSASGLVVRGNYVHGIHLADSGDEAAVTSSYETLDTLFEHNVLRGGTWVFRSFGGELRYNAVLDTESTAWLYQPLENTKVHHNLFLMCHPPRDDIQAGLYLVNNRAVGIEFYNNTLDAGGTTMRATGPAVAIDKGCFLGSLRSNAIYGFPYFRNDGGAAAVRPGALEGVVPPPVRLGYADYNLFYNPEAPQPRNYSVSVQGHSVRTDGFGGHDVHTGGPVDEQVDPGPHGMAGGCFPWTDEDIESSKVTVSQILKALRAGYTPRPTGPLLGGGDPADGPANPIGAVGDGTGSRDLFGKFGP